MELQSVSLSSPSGDPGITELERERSERGEGLGLKLSWEVRRKGGKACGEVGDKEQNCSGYIDNLQLSSEGNVTLL